MEMIVCTPVELQNLIAAAVAEAITSVPPQLTKDKQYVYGLSGLASLIGCSHPTAQRIKDSGKIPYQQIGRKLVFDADAVMSALNKRR